jgi:hypothetical protein
MRVSILKYLFLLISPWQSFQVPRKKYKNEKYLSGTKDETSAGCKILRNALNVKMCGVYFT